MTRDFKQLLQLWFRICLLKTDFMFFSFLSFATHSSLFLVYRSATESTELQTLVVKQINNGTICVSTFRFSKKFYVANSYLTVASWSVWRMFTHRQPKYTIYTCIKTLYRNSWIGLFIRLCMGIHLISQKYMILL